MSLPKFLGLLNGWLAVVIALLAAGLVLGPMGFLVYMVGKRRNWARIILLVLITSAILFSIIETIQSPNESPFWDSNYNIQAILQIVGLVLLFHRDASPWFNRDKNLDGGSAQDKPDTEEISSDTDTAFQIEIESAERDKPLHAMKFRPLGFFTAISAVSMVVFFLGLGVVAFSQKGDTFSSVLRKFRV